MDARTGKSPPAQTAGASRGRRRQRCAIVSEPHGDFMDPPLQHSPRFVTSRFSRPEANPYRGTRPRRPPAPTRGKVRAGSPARVGRAGGTPPGESKVTNPHAN
ncbi:hypothetical protein BGLA2_1070099 [Burkholderia gladioli]|nr:hypothetical protein BGLA2_1070099 [Burkholderia gladioli]